MRKELLVQRYERVICSFHVYIVSKIIAISLLLSFISMCLLLFVIIPYEYCFFFSGSFSVKRFEACKYCYSSRHCSHTKVSHTGIWISGKCHCMFITGCYVAACIDVILLNVIHLDTVYWGFLPAVCWFWCLVLFVCLFVFSGKRPQAIYGWLWRNYEHEQCPSKGKQNFCLYYFFWKCRGITDFNKVIYLLIYFAFISCSYFCSSY